MSHNYRFYALKMEELRVCREVSRPLYSQLNELLLFVRECEAHWESRGVYVSSAQKPETIHDFYGFPQPLFDVRYPAPGDPTLAQRVTQRIKSAQVHTTAEYGLDHGAWSVLRIMYPNADIPVLQFSLDRLAEQKRQTSARARLAPCWRW